MADKIDPGRLVVTIQYGDHTTHVVEGPMGLHPTGVVTILRAAPPALDEHKRLERYLKSHGR